MWLLLTGPGLGVLGWDDLPGTGGEGQDGTEGVSSDVGWTDGALLQPGVTSDMCPPDQQAPSV